MARNPHPTKERFLSDVANHEMTILVDVAPHFRQLKFRAPNTFNLYFYISTWDDHLAISGDMGTFVFSRLPDMFEFFRGKEINTGYWYEKLEAADRRTGGALVFSPEAYLEAIEYNFNECWEFETPEEKQRARKELEFYGILNEPYSEMEAREKAEGYQCSITQQEFTDFWEVDLTDYSYHFVWACYAIVWAIEKYDGVKSAAS